MWWNGPRIAGFWWIVVLVVVSVVVSLPGKEGKLYRTFAHAGNNFRDGLPLYGEIHPSMDQYRYSPGVAALLTPWGLLPDRVSGVAFRLAQSALFLWGAVAWLRGNTVANRRWIALLLMIPLVVGNVHNAQLNLAVAGLCMLAVAAFQRQRYGWCAAAVALATAVKIYPLALGLLLLLLAPKRFGWRLAAALIFAVVFPYLLQSRAYVSDQYLDWYLRLGGDDRSDHPMHSGYHDFQRLLKRWGWDIPLSAYRIIEVMAGFGAAVLVMIGRHRECRIGGGESDRQRHRDRLLLAVFGLASIWMTLFGPSSESATYMLLAPYLVQSMLRRFPCGPIESAALFGPYLLMISVGVAGWFPNRVADQWRLFVPLGHAAFILMIWSVVDLFRAHAPPKSPTPPQPPIENSPAPPVSSS